MMFASQLCFLTYAVSSVLGIYDLRHRTSQHGARPVRIIAFALFCVGTLAGAIALQRFAVTSGGARLPVWSHGLALTLALLTLVGHYGLRMRYLTSFVAPFLALLLFGGLYLEEFRVVSGLDAGQMRQKLVAFHLAGAILGQGFALGACIVASLYLWQRWALKEKLLRQLATRIPALDQMEGVLIACLWAGFLCLSAALASGWGVLRPVHAQGELFDNYFEKLVWAVSVWLWYCLALLGRIFVRLSGKKLAQMSVGGFLLLALAFFGFFFWDQGVFGE